MSLLTTINDVLNAQEPDHFYRHVLDMIADGVYLVDRQRRIWIWNEAAARLSGFAPLEVIGSCCKDNLLMHVDETGRCLCEGNCPLSATMEDGQSRETLVFLHHKAGHRLPVRVRTAALRDGFGRIIGAVETFSDNSTQQAMIGRIAQLEQLAYIDAPTGLPNRRFVQASLDARLAEGARHETQWGVILADVDAFKHINDRYGHPMGDQILQMVARTLAHNARPHDVVGRWGGEEFLIIAGNGGNDLMLLAQRLRSLVASSCLEVEGQLVGATISMGVAEVRPGESCAELLRRADDLLCRAKANGRNRCEQD